MKVQFPHFSALILSCLLLASCGTSVKTFSTDPKSVDQIMRESEDRIAKISFDDSTMEYGSRVTIGADFTEWTIADVARRTFNETYVFRPSDSWRIIEGTKRRKVATRTIVSIIIPSDRVGTGMFIGGVIGTAVGIGFVELNSSFNSNNYAALNVLTILLAVALGFDGLALGGTIGAQHETEYIRAPEMH